MRRLKPNQTHCWRHKWEQISRRLQASLDQKLSRSTKKTSWRNLNLHVYDEQDANTNGAAFSLSTISLRRPRWRAYIPATASKLSSHEIAGGKNDHLCTMILRSEDCHIKLSAQWKVFSHTQTSQVWKGPCGHGPNWSIQLAEKTMDIWMSEVEVSPLVAPQIPPSGKMLLVMISS
jgi:hypothetical protein